MLACPTNPTTPAFSRNIDAPAGHWPLVAAATATLTMGIRQSFGLAVQPLARDIGGLTPAALATARW